MHNPFIHSDEDPAWIDYRNHFAETYDDLNYKGRLRTWVMDAGHKRTEKNYTHQDFFEKVLEVGAGTGHHLPPRKKSIAQGIAYDYAMAREHVNSCHNVIAILQHYFPGAQKYFWPLPIKSIDLNLFFVCHVQIEKPSE